jgi:YD repeat-containing protein
MSVKAAPQFNAANNRITQNGNGQGVLPAYDAAGNLTNHLHIGAMAYDAENHQTSFTGASGTATYQYDGDGRRVKKLQGKRTTVFVYDAFGNLTAEYDTQPAPNLMAGAYYRTTDHLGSTRLVTNATGAVVSKPLKGRRDFRD